MEQTVYIFEFKYGAGGEPILQRLSEEALAQIHERGYAADGCAVISVGVGFTTGMARGLVERI